MTADRITLSAAAHALGLSRQRLHQLARAGTIRVHTDALSGWRYVTERELRRFAALARRSGRPRKLSR